MQVWYRWKAESLYNNRKKPPSVHFGEKSCRGCKRVGVINILPDLRQSSFPPLENLSPDFLDFLHEGKNLLELELGLIFLLKKTLLGFL